MLNIKKYITLFILGLRCCFSFGQSAENDGIKQVTCAKDTSQKYVLYIPKNYNDTTLYPLLIFLDPVARGDVPILKYKNIAEETGIIMAGSYISRNFDPASSETAFTAIYNDIVNKYSVEANAVWLCGFSGGARAASALGMMYKEISGVIACGAGFSDDAAINPSVIKNYAAIVGRKDMNYTEVLDNNIFLDSNNVNNIRLVFEGGHQWPEKEMMKLALKWGLSLKAKDSVSAADEYLNDRVKAFQAGYYYEPLLELNQLAKIPACNTKASAYAKTLSSMEQFQEDKKKFEEAYQLEVGYINKFSLLLSGLLTETGSVDRKAWQQCESELTTMSLNGNRYVTSAVRRCIDHSYRSLSESYYYLMETGGYNKALRLAEAWTSLQLPEQNPWYLAARAAAMMDKKKAAEKYLKEASQNPRFSKERVMNDNALLKVFKPEELMALLNN